MARSRLPYPLEAGWTGPPRAGRAELLTLTGINEHTRECPGLVVDPGSGADPTLGG